MKTKRNYLLIIALLAALLGGGTGVAQAQAAITISPDKLATAEYYTQYSQQITASGGSEPYTFSLLSGTLPSNITLSPSGLLSGLAASTPGTYPITIQAMDANGVSATRVYDLVLGKGMPTVTAQAETYIYWNYPFTVWAKVLKEYSPGTAAILDGTVAFSIDGTPVPGCAAVTKVDGQFVCPDVSMNLGLGDHTVKADYTPTGWYEPLFYPASGSGTFNVQPGAYTVAGQLFNDLDQDGEYDADEYSLGKTWTVNLDQDCDGTPNYTTTTDWWYSSFYFYSIPGGHCYRYAVVSEPGWQQTTQPEPFWLSSNPTPIAIGYYYPTITISPSQLPEGSVGVEYSQQFTASGGDGPYTYTMNGEYWPDGLTLSEAGILSGTPTEGGIFNVEIQAEDTNGAAGTGYYLLKIKTDADFTFTSSANPSAAGEAVTFTVSATGEAYHFYAGMIPPAGPVAFFADGIPIEGCSDLDLNWSEGQYGDYPATCTTTALSTGSHEITATYTDFSEIFNTPSLALTQVVEQSDTTPPEVSVTGVTEGATYVLGSVPQAGCSTTDALSGVATEASLSLSGGDAQGLGSFTATCSGAVDNAGNLADPVSVHYTVIASADLSIGKTDSKDPVKPGANLVYTLVISNVGPNAAQNLTLQDTLDRNTTYVSVSAPGGWTCTYVKGKVTCTSTSLASGGSATIKITVTVNKTAKVGKDLINNAMVSSVTYDPVLTNNTAVQKTLVAK